MLDSEAGPPAGTNDHDQNDAQHPSEATGTTPTRRPRRRAASRPAGPPAAEPTPPTPDEAPVAPAPDATDRSGEVAAEPLVSAGGESAPAATEEPAPVAKKAARKTAAKRTTKKAAAKTAAAPGDEQAAGPEQAEPPAKPVRKRATRKAAAPSVPADPPAPESPAESPAGPGDLIAPVEDVTVTEPDAAPADSATVETAGPETSASETPAAGTAGTEAAAADAPAADAAASDFGAETAPTGRRGSRRRGPLTDPFAVPDIDLDRLTGRGTRPADEPPAEHPTDETDETADTADTADTDETGEADKTDEADVVGQQALAEAADGADGASDDDQSDEDQGDNRRRRRRRGGRRRRRGGADDDASDDAGEQQNGSSDGPAERSTPDAASAGDAADGDHSAATESSDGRSGNADETDSDDGDDGSGDGESGSRRRRRRRRRRGESSGSSPDDPTEVVERVREPRSRGRSRSSANDTPTGIEGSTRMEAKRQRRREGREAGRRRAPILSEAEFLARRESVNRKMIIRQLDELAQIAVLEDGILVEHYVDRESATSLIGNVYLGRVQNVLPSMEAAFIDIGRGRNAVLYAGEVDWESFGAEGGERKVERVLKSGQTILVQASKDPVGAKGARLTNHVSIPGRYLVYAPGGHLSGISRKLPENERKRLKDILAGPVGDTASVIVRTAAEGASEDELVRDVNRLKAQWTDIESKIKSGSAPQLLYAEPDLTIRIVRDLFTEDFSELIIQGNGSMNDAYDSVEGYAAHVAPHLKERIRRWDVEADGDLFGAYRLDEQIAKGLERKVFLPSGGSLIIDRTEAMTVIDVNTGKFTGSGGNLEATITSNNLEAAEEIVRQLRLRDIGGIIVIDFIDMVLPSNRELLLRRLVECLGRDRTRHQVAEVTSLGLVQMTRKKIGTGLLEAFSSECPHCHGRGVELHDMPVETQKQADGGARDDHNRRNNNRGGGDSNGSGQSGSRAPRRGRGGRRDDDKSEQKPDPQVRPEPEPSLAAPDQQSEQEHHQQLGQQSDDRATAPAVSNDPVEQAVEQLAREHGEHAPTEPAPEAGPTPEVNPAPSGSGRRRSRGRATRPAGSASRHGDSGSDDGARSATDVAGTPASNPEPEHVGG